MFVFVVLALIMRPIRCTRGVMCVDVITGSGKSVKGVVRCPERFLASDSCMVASLWKSLSSTSEKQQFDMARVFGA